MQQKAEPKTESLNGVIAALRLGRKHWPLIVACLLLGAGLSLLYSKSSTRIYQSSAMVELNPNPPRPLSDKVDAIMPLGGAFFDNREYFETQLRIATSTPVLMAAARAASLTGDWAFFGLKSAPGKPFSDEQAANALRSRVSVEPVRNSRLMLIRVTDENPERARKLCEAVMNAYIEQNLEKAISATSDSVVWLAGQVQTVKKELETDENALHSFKEENSLPSTSINESSNMVRLELQELSTGLTRTRSRRGELAARLAELSKVMEDRPEQLPASELLSNLFLQNLRQTYQEALNGSKALAAQGKGDNHPDVRAAQGRLAEAKGALLAEIANIKGAAERDLSAVARQEAMEQKRYDDAHRRAVELTMKEIQYHRLDRSRDQNEKLYATLLQSMKEADMARMMRVNNLIVREPPDLPRAPIFPRTRANVSVGAFLGLLLGLALVWIRDSLDNTLKTPEDVEQKLGVAFLGLLPANAENPAATGRRRLRPRPASGIAPELVVHAKPLSGIAEAARSVRTNLMFTSPDKPFRMLLVTSAAPAEGKTTVACSLAIAFAQSGQRVCIIDCDLRRPRLHRIFERAGDAGVTNVLVGDASIDEVAHATVIENLYCIPSGPIPPNPADMLHSEKFRAFLAEVGRKFDRVILDSPPLIAVTDSAIISTLVDGTVYVLRAFSTTTSMGRQGFRSLTDVGARVAGAVLNAVDLSKHEYSYHQYYYYKRDGYGSNEADAAPDPEDEHRASAN